MSLQLPQEFSDQLKSQLGSDFSSFESALNDPPPVSIRLNPAKINTIAGNQPIPWCASGQYLSERPVFTLDPKFHGGAYYVQEASSMFLEQAVRQSVELSRPLKVLDLCAAPGGKSTHLLSLLSEESLLIANDAIRSRASVLSENIQKWGNRNVIVTSNDPQAFERLPGFFDLIVVDAPCSGEGLFRKEPDAIKEWSLKNVELCSLRQRRILGDVWASLKTGGVLIYCTCTYNDKENEGTGEWLGSTYQPEFIRLSVPAEWKISDSGTGYHFYPHHLKGEGFFLSAWRKKDQDADRIRKIRDTLNYPSATQVKEFSSWVERPESTCFFQHHDTVRMINQSSSADLQTILNQLNVISAGTAVLEIMKNKFIPDHGLGLSNHIRKENFNTIQVNKEQALSYLRKDTLLIDSPNTGFARIEYDGIGLGWVNVLQNRINNLYPANWRIRMRS